MKLTCFQLDDHPMEIVPGRPDREWMDGTIERRAYRCLPLSIANTTGWEIICPVSFRASWTGQSQGTATRIEGAPGGVTHMYPPYVHTYFADGVITFHTGWRFTTEKGWDLWVGGAPNFLKHGIQPLTGIVETDWLPQPFSMNWRFTAPGTVEFKAGEPIAFIMPVPHAAIDAVEPVIERLADRREEHDATMLWAKSRRDYIEAKGRGEVAPTEWQRDYFQGHHPDGKPGPDTHINKRRLKAPRKETR